MDQWATLQLTTGYKLVVAWWFHTINTKANKGMEKNCWMMGTVRKGMNF